MQNLVVLIGFLVVSFLLIGVTRQLHRKERALEALHKSLEATHKELGENTASTIGIELTFKPLLERMLWKMGFEESAYRAWHKAAGEKAADAIMATAKTDNIQNTENAALLAYIKAAGSAADLEDAQKYVTSATENK